MQNRIDFLLIGAQKAGTTALAYYLEKHPSIGLSSRKEVHFFDKDKWFIIPKLGYYYYHRYFSFDSDYKKFGEATPSYLWCKTSYDRIRKYNPDIKLLVILRNPIDRAFSHWNMVRSRGYEPRSFEEVISSTRVDMLDLGLSRHTRKKTYVERGFYYWQLKPFFDVFNREQIHVIKYESFKDDQPGHLANIFSFLGVDPYIFKFKPVSKRKGSYEEKVTEKQRKALIKLYEEDIKKLERLLDWDCSDWLEQ